MIVRSKHGATVQRLLRENPVVTILGARQVGKTTLARQVATARRGDVERFDLEDPADVARLGDARLALAPLRGLVVLDEIQRRPDLFPLLRVLADRRPRPARFLVLGSASPELLNQSSESLAGRVAVHELGGFGLDEVGVEHLDRLWLRGGFPEAFLARSGRASFDWRRNLIRTVVERDLPQLGVSIPGATLSRFWAMLAHYHGQIWNSADFARSFGVSDKTVRHYLHLLESTLLVRLLPPWHASIRKRQVKSPKIYIRDTGLLHTLLGLGDSRALQRHPKVGASWEGFLLQQIIARLDVQPEECFFWATHTGAELDFLWARGPRRWGFEIKRTSAPTLTKSLRTAIETLGLQRAYVVHAGAETFRLDRNVIALAASHILDDIG